MPTYPIIAVTPTPPDHTTHIILHSKQSPCVPGPYTYYPLNRVAVILDSDLGAICISCGDSVEVMVTGGVGPERSLVDNGIVSPSPFARRQKTDPPVTTSPSSLDRWM